MFAGALAIPLGLEILWRFDGVTGSHLQPEVVTVEVGGQDLVRGQDPYHPLVKLHHPVKYHAPGQPDYAGFLPYLPVMAVLGIPSEIWPNNGLSDARIFFCLTTLAVAAVALYLCRADGRRKIRALQALVILPLASLPLATGGDDIPVVAVLLLAVVLAQRRRPFASGVVFGIASAMKFTAWPLAALALFAARGRNGERRPLSMLAGMVVVAVPTIFPFALRGPFALIDDVVLFPLGLSAIPSTAASALPGHVLVTAFPSLSRALPLSVGIVLSVLLVRHLYRHTPRTVSEVCNIAGVVMAALILLAPNPRGRLPAVPDQLLRVGLPAGRAGGPVRAAPQRRCGGAGGVLWLRESAERVRGCTGTAVELLGVAHLQEPEGEVRLAPGRAAGAERRRRDDGAHLPVVAVGARQLAQHLEGARMVGRRPPVEDLPPLQPHVRGDRTPAVRPGSRRTGRPPGSRIERTARRCPGARSGPSPPGRRRR